MLDATGGTLDALYNNGAFAMLGAVEDVPTAGLRELFEANFFGWHTPTRTPTLTLSLTISLALTLTLTLTIPNPRWHTLTQLAVRTMRAQGPRGRGRIVQHSSGFGLFAG